MHPAFLAFIVGNIVAAQGSLPIDSPLPGLLIPLCCLGLGFARLRVPVAALLASVLVLAAQQVELDRRLPATDARVDVRLTGSVDSLPLTQGQATRFVFRIEEGAPAGTRYQLTWFRPDIELRAGDVFTLHARLGAPSAAVNFDLFDYEKWLFTRHIHGRGYVLQSPPPKRRVSTCLICVLQARAWFRSELASVASGNLSQDNDDPDMVAKERAVATQLALSLGDTSLLSLQDWQVLNQTGTTHLLIVSGLHVGLIATLVYAFLGVIGLPLNLRIAGTLTVTFVYALLSGWGLPVQRAFLMTLVYFSAGLLYRHIPLTGRFVGALFVVLVFDPMASLSRGFWLSFGVVFALIFALTRTSVSDPGLTSGLHGAARGMLVSQWVAYLALLPLIGFYTQTLPIGALLTNLVAIPWVSLFIVPITLAALAAFMVSDSLAALLLGISGELIQGLWWFLRWIDGLRMLLPVRAFPVSMLVCAVTGMLILLLPRGLIARWPGIFLMLLAFTQRPLSDESSVTITFLDVGQGLSVLIETPDGVVLYDTGPDYPGGHSTAAQTILPTLRARGHRWLHTLVISHSDNDHAGGVETVIEGIAVPHFVQFGDCHHQWQLGEVQFKSFDLIAPESAPDGPVPDNAAVGHAASDNATSCLLSVSWGAHRVLLTGDIEAAEEYRLLALDQHLIEQSPLTLLLVPHHGSASSSTPALLNQLMPEIAVVSTGYLNRFGHPVDEVVARYHARGIRLLDTAASGAIRIRFHSGATNDFEITTARGEPAGVWRRR